jgi:hypothetical protein
MVPIPWAQVLSSNLEPGNKDCSSVVFLGPYVVGPQVDGGIVDGGHSMLWQEVASLESSPHEGVVLDGLARAGCIEAVGACTCICP